MIWHSLLWFGPAFALPFLPHESGVDGLLAALNRRPFALNHAAFASWKTFLQSGNRDLQQKWCYSTQRNHDVEIDKQHQTLLSVNVSIFVCKGNLHDYEISETSSFLTVLIDGNKTFDLPLSRLRHERPLHVTQPSSETLLNFSSVEYQTLRQVTKDTLGPPSERWIIEKAFGTQSTFVPPCQHFLVAVSQSNAHEATLVWVRDFSHYTFKTRRRNQFQLQLVEPRQRMLHSIIVHYDSYSLNSSTFSSYDFIICSNVTDALTHCRSPPTLTSHTWHSLASRRLSTVDQLPKREIKVMSYNIWNYDSGPHWDRRLPGLAQTIRDESPDIVGLQEIRHEFSDGLNQLTQLQALLPGYQHHFEPAQVERTQEEGLGFLSKYPLMNISFSKLPITQSADLTQRICLHTIIQYGSSHLSFFVTHLAFVSEPQLLQAFAVMKFLNKIRDSFHYPQGIVGDWNFYPNDPKTHDYLVGHNVHKEADPPAGDLTEAFQPENTWPTWGPFVNRPDRIYFRNGVSECSLPGDEACWARSHKIFANLTYLSGFTKEPGNHNAVNSDHVAVITSLHTCDAGYTYVFDPTLAVPRNLTTFGPLAGVSRCIPACLRHCGPNASCIAPDVCACDPGFRMTNRGCISIFGLVLFLVLFGIGCVLCIVARLCFCKKHSGYMPVDGLELSHVASFRQTGEPTVDDKTESLEG